MPRQDIQYNIPNMCFSYDPLDAGKVSLKQLQGLFYDCIITKKVWNSSVAKLITQTEHKT